MNKIAIHTAWHMSTDDESLLWFLEQEYHTEAICQIDEVITSYREVDYADYFANLKNMTK